MWDNVAVTNGRKRDKTEVTQLHHPANNVVGHWRSYGGEGLRLYLNDQRIGEGPSVAEQQISADRAINFVPGNLPTPQHVGKNPDREETDQQHQAAVRKDDEPVARRRREPYRHRYGKKRHCEPNNEKT